MSYVPLRHPAPDNPDLAGLPEDAYERLVPLADLIKASHLEGYHQSECGCTKPICWTREHHGDPSTEEVLGWLAAKGLLDINAAEQFASDGTPAPAKSDPLTDYAVELMRAAARNVDAMTIEDCATDELGRELTTKEVEKVQDVVHNSQVVVLLPPGPES
ncbi:hypothetical protein AB0425_17745 [Actinosynnema sp. NPDC051121]